ncbi:MAG TPA: TolC family protein [archaeon]|nr:TolC family protein [archaeon]
MVKRYFHAAAGLTIGSILLFVQACPAITVAETVSFAMEHNRDILAVKQQIAERRGQVIEARADAFPQLNLSISSFRMRDPGFLNSTFGQALLKGESISGDGENGGMPFPIEAIMPRPITYYDMVMNVSQPIFTWGKVSNAVQLAKMGINDIDLSLEAMRQDVAYQVTSAYYDVLLAQETIAMYEKSIETQKRYLRQTRDFFELGDATRLDVLRAEAQLAATEPGLLEANNSLIQAQKNLNFLLGRPLDSELYTADVKVMEDYSPPSLEEVIVRAAANRPDLRRLNLQVEMYDKTINVFKADFRPRADLFGSYGFSTIRTQDLFDRNFESWRIALQVSVPVFDGFKNRGVIMQYKSRQSQTEIASAKLAEQIRLDALQSIDACSSAAEVYRARKISLESVEEEERVTADQFEQGLATMYELLDSNRRVIETRINYLDARYNLLREIAALKRVMGIPVDALFSNNG